MILTNRIVFDILQFKEDANVDPSIERRFYDQEKTSPFIRVVTFDLAQFIYSQFVKPTIVTSSIRYEEENTAVGGSAKSRHIPFKDKDGKWTRCCAVDLRTWHLEEKEIRVAQKHIHQTWFIPLGGELLYEKHAPRGSHLHLQVGRRPIWL